MSLATQGLKEAVGEGHRREGRILLQTLSVATLFSRPLGLPTASQSPSRCFCAEPGPPDTQPIIAS